MMAGIPDIVHLPAVRVEVLLSDHEWRIDQPCDINNVPCDDVLPRAASHPVTQTV